MYKVFNTITREFIQDFATLTHNLYTKEQAKELAKIYTKLVNQKHTVIKN